MSHLTPTPTISSPHISTQSDQRRPPHADELVGAIYRSLSHSPFRELDGLPIDLRDNTICIGGHVSSYYLKQMAQEIVRKLAPSHRIVNEVAVYEPR